MSARIRRATAEDASAAREVDTLAFPAAGVVSHRSDPGGVEASVVAGEVLVAEVDGRVVAYAQREPVAAGVELLNGMGVIPDFQGRGLGRRLLGRMCAEVRAAGLELVTVTSPLNVVMLSVLMREGFVVTAYLPDYFGPGRDRLALQLGTGGVLESPYRWPAMQGLS